MSSEKKKLFKVPHTFVIILFIILFAVMLTWIVPAGEFERFKNDQGINVINPQAFTYTEKMPVSLFQIPKHIVEGLIKSAELFFLIILSGGAFSVIVTSGALQGVIGKIAKRFSHSESVFIPLLTLAFGLICTTQGVNMFIGFAPVMVMMARAMGFDSIVGVAVILLGGAVGFSTGTLNPSTTIVAQKIGELPLYSGIEYRAFSFVVYMIITNIFLIRYAKSIRKDPTLSPMYELDQRDTLNSDTNLEDMSHMDTRKWMVILSLVSVLAVIVYGGIKLDWGLSESSAAFLWLGIIAGVFAGFGPSEIAGCFVDGAKKMVSAALIIGMAKAVSGVLSAGHIIDTIVFALGNMLNVVPSFAQGIAMYIANNFINAFITSGSGQAAATMPIIMPLSDMVGLTRQTAVLAYNFGDGFSNYILPTSTALMGILGAANIPYDRWMKFMWKMFLIWVVTGSVLVFIAQMIHLGPM
ncbi:YfcC family protein [Fusibacter sp. 3D3]|uniref:YfcC family protein n=1 Tax=Fusibacter sp. 3D3 TaxID=1048380 RepID=UPI0008534FCA|nr:Na+/H+ antiporter NhaC family protein [Fusibacter sp. 3D3]GAU79043.1 arginine/ornithine antiporter ArcD [Fusibacter sp. 3D3]